MQLNKPSLCEALSVWFMATHRGLTRDGHWQGSRRLKLLSEDNKKCCVPKPRLKFPGVPWSRLPLLTLFYTCPFRGWTEWLKKIRVLRQFIWKREMHLPVCLKKLYVLCPFIWWPFRYSLKRGHRTDRENEFFIIPGLKQGIITCHGRSQGKCQVWVSSRRQERGESLAQKLFLGFHGKGKAGQRKQFWSG